MGEIARWTIRTFGRDVAIRYRSSLIEGCHALVTGERPKGRPCGLILGTDHPATELRYIRIGSHYAIYRRTSEAVQILDFVHQSRDLGAIVSDLVALQGQTGRSSRD